MPVPPKLSRKFHEIFGSEAADAMAEWMDQMEETTAELRADIAELRHEMQVGFARVDARFAQMDVRFAGLEGLFDRLEATMETRMLELKTVVEGSERKLSETKYDILKWAIGFWLASLGLMTAMLGAFIKLSR